LFHSVGCNNFEIARLLMKNGTKIDNLNSESKNIIEYLIEKRNLNSVNLLFILNIVNNASLITPSIICSLIKLNDLKFIEEILQYKYFDVSFIINLLLNYKSKAKRSECELKSINNLNKGKIKINNKTETENYPLLNAISLDNIEIVKLLMNYASINNIVLELNEKDIYFPLLEAINNNNIEMVILLMEYATEHNIILKINEKDKEGWSPLLISNADNVDNAEIIKLLMKYANQNNIILEINEKFQNK